MIKLINKYTKKKLNDKTMEYEPEIENNFSYNNNYKLQKEYYKLLQDYENNINDYNNLKDDYNKIVDKLNNLKDENKALKKIWQIKN